MQMMIGQTIMAYRTEQPLSMLVEQTKRRGRPPLHIATLLLSWDTHWKAIFRRILALPTRVRKRISSSSQWIRYSIKPATCILFVLGTMRTLKPIHRMDGTEPRQPRKLWLSLEKMRLIPVWRKLIFWGRSTDPTAIP